MATLDVNNLLAALQDMDAPEVPEIPDDPSVMDRARNFLNPNTIRAFGELAAGMGDGQSFGQAAGGAASMNERRKASQRAGAQASTQDRNVLTGIMQALQNGTLLSPTEDNDAFDNMSLDGDGGVTLKMKSTPTKQRLPKTLSDEPLENQLGGLDLPGF